MGSKEIKSENESVGDILRSSMTDLAEQNKEAYDFDLKV